MLIIICACVLAAARALPTPQVLAPAAALTAIPATNHILILTPQAQVQLEPSLKYPQPIVEHLTPIARIDSPTDQTVVYYPNENLINKAYQKSELKPKQIESANITNIVNQFVSAGQTAQAQLEAFQQQLTQGLETLIQPSAGQEIEEEKDSIQKDQKATAAEANKLIETARLEGGRFYSIPGAPHFYSNFELVQSPVNPLYAIHPYTAVRARSVLLPDEKFLDAKSDGEKLSENISSIPLKTADKKQIETEIVNVQFDGQKNIDGRSIENKKTPEKNSQPELINIQGQEVSKENSHFGKYLGSLEKKSSSLENISELKKEELTEGTRNNKDENASDLGSFAEALPSGLAISGEGGVSQVKPIGEAIVGKDGVALSAPSGTAIAGSDNEEKN